MYITRFCSHFSHFFLCILYLYSSQGSRKRYGVLVMKPDCIAYLVACCKVLIELKIEENKSRKESGLYVYI